MFYSKTLLARKGPFGTVWCAAHLEHKLKKSHITSTNIPSTVDRIMFPEVPIALRMSGHLLLGVVRIFSKQVDYFSRDCKVLLTELNKAYASSNVNLPENVTRATEEAVTLPNNFRLDAMELDDDFHTKRANDSHQRSPEEITIEDQIPVGHDPYIVVTFNEDVARNSSSVGAASGSGPQSMEENSGPQTPVGATEAAQDPGPSNQERVEVPHNERTPQSIPEIEVMRDATIDYRPEDILFWPDQRDDQMEPDKYLMAIIKENDNHIPEVELQSGGSSIPSAPCREPVSAASEQGLETLDSHDAFEHVTPELAVRSTPPAEQQPRNRPRKRRQQYDETTVLSNRYMKGRLDDWSDTIRKKKRCPCSSLDIWKMSNRIKKDTVLFDPLMTGLCNDLRNAYNKDFISSKPYLAFVEEAIPTDGESSASIHDSGMEIERLRNYEHPIGNTVHELIHSPNRVLSSPTRSMPSPSRREEATPVVDTDKSAWSEQVGTTIRTTSDFGASTGPFGSDFETPMTFLEERIDVENASLSDIPEMVNSADGDLTFLAEDDNTPAGSQGTPNHFLRRHSGASQVDTLPVRTRAVAQFLKNKSSATPVSDNQSEELSLNKILEGKRKKVCARMVFETLVLKTSGLIDLKQEEPYGDITLKITPKLSKEQFSS